VLIVDDNADAAETLRMMLELKGHDVVTAHDGAQALRAVETFGPEIVLLDIGLPEMDGHEVARRIRAMPGGELVMLYAITGWGQDQDKRRAQEAGFDGHLTKPVNAARLLALLTDVRSGRLRSKTTS
jgi:CheY-like chemotaxis protein